jgi:cytochrome oxidase assembly protein ShyY1
MNDVADLDPVSNQWRKINLTGKFSQSNQELVRNRYYEGKFGFEVLTLFTATNGENFWVDRGWVAAGPNAATPPVVEPIASGSLEITARIRSENLSRQLQGSFFVTRASSEKPESIAKLQGIDANAYYLDLLGSPSGQVKPLTEIELPELSNGPHYAYGIQWLAFALLTLIGRFLLFREAKRLALVKLEV